MNVGDFRPHDGVDLGDEHCSPVISHDKVAYLLAHCISDRSLHAQALAEW